MKILLQLNLLLKKINKILLINIKIINRMEKKLDNKQKYKKRIRMNKMMNLPGHSRQIKLLII